MNGNRGIILDSNIIIYLSQRKLSLNDIFIDSVNYSVSIITYMEILSYNFKIKEEEEFIYKLFSFLNIIDIDRTIAKKVISLKKKRKIKLPDAIIVLTALVYNATLYTNDKQLHNIEELKVRFFDIK